MAGADRGDPARCAEAGRRPVCRSASRVRRRRRTRWRTHPHRGRPVPSMRRATRLRRVGAHPAPHACAPRRHRWQVPRPSRGHRRRGGRTMTRQPPRRRRPSSVWPPAQGRPTTGQRGYGPAHKRLREQVGKQVAAGRAVCARCGKPIHPTAKWHLDHHDTDRTRYLGPSHAACNIGAAQRRRWRREAGRDPDSPPPPPPPRPRALRFFDGGEVNG